MKDLNLLPLTQMRLLIRLWNNHDKMGFAEGRGEGGSIKELYKKSLVEPAGRVGRRVRWKLINSKLAQRDIDLMSGLVKQDSLPAEQEGLIVELLGEAKDLSILIA